MLVRMNDVNALVDIYDSEIPALEEAVAALNEQVGQRRDLESFRQEAIERFAKAGFEVKVTAHYTRTPGLFAFDIDIIGRLDPEPFDHERQSYEVRHDVLGIDGAVTIGPNGEVRDTMRKDKF